VKAQTCSSLEQIILFRGKIAHHKHVCEIYQGMVIFVPNRVKLPFCGGKKA